MPTNPDVRADQFGFYPFVTRKVSSSVTAVPGVEERLRFEEINTFRILTNGTRVKLVSMNNREGRWDEPFVWGCLPCVESFVASGTELTSGNRPALRLLLIVCTEHLSFSFTGVRTELIGFLYKGLQ